jgi:hypothetical protein
VQIANVILDQTLHHYNLTRVALAKKDRATAKTEADAFRKGMAAQKNPFQTKQGPGPRKHSNQSCG